MKFCVFCGNKIPKEAIFCSSCGSKQPEAEKKDENTKATALSLLNQAKFQNKDTGKVFENKEMSSGKEKYFVSEKQNVDNYVENVENQAAIKKEEDVKPDVLAEQTENIGIIEEEYVEESAVYDTEDEYIPEPYVPPILLDTTKELEQDQQSKKEESEKEEPEKKESEKEDRKPPKDISKPKRRALYKKRNLSEEDESEKEEIDTTMHRQTSLGYNNTSELLADEKADLKKAENYKEEEEKKDKSKGEGRKAKGRKKEARKNIDKEIANRKINKIEHEQVKKNEDIDPDYDGYYENVKPIDYDKQKDNSSLFKTILTVFTLIALISGIFYILITFFLL